MTPPSNPPRNPPRAPRKGEVWRTVKQLTLFDAHTHSDIYGDYLVHYLDEYDPTDPPEQYTPEGTIILFVRELTSIELDESALNNRDRDRSWWAICKGQTIRVDDIDVMNRWVARVR